MPLTSQQKQSLQDSSERIAERIEDMLCDEAIETLNQAEIDGLDTKESEAGENFLRRQIAKIILHD